MERIQEIRITNRDTGRSVNVHFPCRDEELNNAARVIGIEDAVPYATIKIKNVGESVMKHLDGMKVNLDEVNYFFKRMDSMTEKQALKIQVYAEENRITDMKDLINLTFSESEFHLLSDFSDLNRMGKQIYFDKYGGMTKDEENGVDFVKLAEDTIQNSRTSVTKHGVLVGEGTISEVYDGRLFPEYLYNSEETNLIVRIANQSGDEQSLYLPADITSVDKVKARLGVERLADCTITIGMHILPENLLEKFNQTVTAEELTYLNEFCDAVKGFSDHDMVKLEMAAEAMNLNEFTKLTALSRCLNSIDVFPDVLDMEQYGKHVALADGNLKADSFLLPFINFEALGENMLNQNDQIAFHYFLKDGLVVSRNNGMEVMSYSGEYAKYLELPEGELISLKLYSPLVAAEYQKEDMDDSGRVELDGCQLTVYEDDIKKAVRRESSPGEAARGLMSYFHGSRNVAGKVVDARPTVEAYQGELYGVLECRLKEPLDDEEYHELAEFWDGQESDGWGEGFEQRGIDFGDRELYVSFWNSDGGHYIKKESELKEPEPEQSLIIL